MNIRYIRINSERDYFFYICFYVYSFFCLTNVLRGLSVVVVQMPIIMFCFALLCISVGKYGSKCTRSFFALTVLLTVLFNFIFIYLQNAYSHQTLSAHIGVNYSLFVASFPILLVASNGFERVDKKKLYRFVMIIVIITAITTIQGTYMYETPCRELATPHNVVLDQLYKSKNIGGFGFIYFLVLTIPYGLRKIFDRFSLLSVVVVLLSVYCIIRSEYATALVFMACVICIGLILRIRNRLVKTIGVVLCALIASNLDNIVFWASNYFSDSFTMSTRLGLIHQYLQTGSATGDLRSRMETYQLSIETFRSNPLFGGLFRLGEEHVGGHSEVVDFVGHAGIFGIIYLLLGIRGIMRMPSLKMVKKDNCVVLMYVAAFVLAIFNPIYTPELIFALCVMPIICQDDSKPSRAVIFGNLKMRK